VPNCFSKFWIVCMVQCALDGKGNLPVPTASLDLDVTKTKTASDTVHLVYLLTAGIFEVAFTLCLKLSESFTKEVWTIGFVVSAVISFSLLNLAIEGIALGTAYAIWTGIGAPGRPSWESLRSRNRQTWPGSS
jgi:hypothetical protein